MNDGQTVTPTTLENGRGLTSLVDRGPKGQTDTTKKKKNGIATFIRHHRPGGKRKRNYEPDRFFNL